MIIFLDTSVLIKRYIKETGSDKKLIEAAKKEGLKVIDPEGK